MDIFWNISHKMYKIGNGGGILARFFEIISMSICSHAISAQISVGNGTIFYHHGVGTVVHQDVIIGENCKIFQNVTIGAKISGKSDNNSVPVIGNNVMIGAGAVLLGNIHIGDNSVIGANAVVLNNIESDTIAVGVPAYVINNT